MLAVSLTLNTGLRELAGELPAQGQGTKSLSRYLAALRRPVRAVTIVEIVVRQPGTLS